MNHLKLRGVWNKHSDLPIKNYLESLYEWQQYPGRIRGGKMDTLVHGHWVNKEEFDEFFPMPVAGSFISKKENIDSTTAWMY